jgi:Protein of unknown function (DUF2283)
MKPQIRMDREHPVAYVKLSDEDVSSTLVVAPGVVLDVSVSGGIVGIELLEPYIEKLDALIALIEGEKP